MVTKRHTPSWHLAKTEVKPVGFHNQRDKGGNNKIVHKKPTMKKFDVFLVHAPKLNKKPRRIVSGVSKLEARRIVKNIPERKSQFAGFVKKGKKVNSLSDFSF